MSHRRTSISLWLGYWLPLLHRVSVQSIFSRWLFSFYTGEICCNLSVQFSHSVMSSSLQPHGLQHARLPCPSPTPRTYSNSCSSSRWCHLTISSSVIPFSSHLQSFPELGSFQMSQFFASRGLSIGVSASASVLPMNIQDWFPLGLTGWISLQSKGLISKASILQCPAFFIVQLSHSYMSTGKTIALTRQTFVGKIVSLLFNMLSRFQSQRKAMPKNAQTTEQLHSSHKLVKKCLKFSKPGFSNTWTVNFLNVQAGFRKGRGRNQRSNCQHLLDNGKSKRAPEKHLFLLY